MSEHSSDVTVEDVDALLVGATPQFSMQIKSRVRALINTLPAGHDVRAYGETQMKVLDALAFGTTRGAGGQGQPRADANGWQEIPSHPRGGLFDTQ
jgi:hypothetical protein